MNLDVAHRGKDDVGEGPVWDFRAQALFWIDVTQGLIHRLDPKTSAHSSFSIGKHIGAVALFSKELLVAAVRDGFATISKIDGTVNYLSQVLSEENIRFNDGKCDPVGRFVAGTMRYQPEPGTAALYSCNDNGEVKEILSGVGLSNGLCWDAAGTHLYYIDTLTKEISLFEYNIQDGTLHNRRTFYTFSANDGSPDGMTIDVDGNLWVALWGGGKVMCISEKARVITEVMLPVSQPTSVTFGGENLDQLFITSAKYQLSQVQQEKQPLAGSLFVANVGVRGVQEPIFGIGR
jgi:sugar lactone lactonase YvrE